MTDTDDPTPDDTAPKVVLGGKPMTANVKSGLPPRLGIAAVGFIIGMAWFAHYDSIKNTDACRGLEPSVFCNPWSIYIPFIAYGLIVVIGTWIWNRFSRTVRDW